MNDISYADQLKVLFVRLVDELGVRIVLGQQIFDKPKDDEGDTEYPYIGYNLLTSRRVANIPFTENADRDVLQWWEEQYEFTISFTAVSKDPFQSMEVATALFNWLSNVGQDFMQSHEIVHVSSTSVTARDFFIVNDFERRAGFDCRLRLGRKVDKTIPRIEQVNIQPGTII